ncbi:uncharacterized protein LOC112506140 [Cynara cardunculus var. scolymus]|uniref:uncharacterized protein LOC112506140 n=1 Tax=Cynara cardunculus var. scolymus TaxID=59895 RepID=UPI000D630C88|nr:uncharacterized protein LOC112506140 [Cynara cardunculus var. scolymus]
MLISNSLSRPEFVWEKTWQYLTDRILYNQQIALQSPDLALNEEQVNNLTLFEIEKILLRNNSTLKNFTTLPYPDNDSLESSNNRLIVEELDYNHHNLGDEFHTLVTALTDEQRGVYDEIMIAVEKKKGGVFFVYEHGGRGKTFLWKTLAASIRSKGEIVLNVASSGIASLLLTGGRIAHSRFHIPLILNEDSLCQMKPDSDVAGLIKKTTLVIWDEAPMVHKYAFEALDRSMNDIFNAQCSGDSNMIFGDKVIIFGGDFRQIMPVIPNAGISNHKILLKVGVPIMLLRNIDQKSGLCNGTRLRVLTLGNRVIEAHVISGSNIGSRIFIPRMSLTPTDKRIPFKFQRRQFPIVLWNSSRNLRVSAVDYSSESVLGTLSLEKLPKAFSLFAF